MRRRFVSFCLVAGLAAAGCGIGLGGGGVYQYAVDVTNSGSVPVQAAISMADGSVTRTIAAGDTSRLTGYANGPYSVSVVLEGPAKDAYIANLQQIQSNLNLVRQSKNSAALQIALENLPLVERQLKDIMSSGLPGCGGELTYEKGLATVTLTNPSGVWRGTCATSNYGDNANPRVGNEP
jgi:hypothetical protein